MFKLKTWTRNFGNRTIMGNIIITRYNELPRRDGLWLALKGRQVINRPAGNGKNI